MPCEIILFEIKFEITVFETKMSSRYKFWELHFRGSRSPYSRLMTFTVFTITLTLHYFNLYCLKKNGKPIDFKDLHFWLKFELKWLFCGYWNLILTQYFRIGFGYRKSEIGQFQKFAKINSRLKTYVLRLKTQFISRALCYVIVIKFLIKIRIESIILWFNIKIRL